MPKSSLKKGKSPTVSVRDSTELEKAIDELLAHIFYGMTEEDPPNIQGKDKKGIGQVFIDRQMERLESIKYWIEDVLEKAVLVEEQIKLSQIGQVVRREE